MIILIKDLRELTFKTCVDGSSSLAWAFVLQLKHAYIHVFSLSAYRLDEV